MKTPRPILTTQKKPVNSFRLVTDPATGALRERFASGIMTRNRGELRRILREIAKISALSESPDKFFRAMAEVLIQTARYARRQRGSQNKSRRFALPRRSDEPVRPLLLTPYIRSVAVGGRAARRCLVIRGANNLAGKPEKHIDHSQTT